MYEAMSGTTAVLMFNAEFWNLRCFSHPRYMGALLSGLFVFKGVVT